MKILMATMGLDIGGAETHIVELSKQLRQQGHDVVLVSNGGAYVPEIIQAGIRHYSAPLHRRTMKEMRRAKQILKRVIQQEKPDVVHAHARIPAFLCGILHRSMKFPFVTTAHWVFDATGVLRYLTDWGERTIAVSEDIRSYLIREYQVPPEQISVTINGIDTDKFSPSVSGEQVIQEFGLQKDRPILSYVSRMDEDRALVARQLIEIAPQLERKIPGIQLLIAGGGNVFSELNEKAQVVNQKLGRTCVVMTGPRTDINEIVAAGDVFVGVSRAALEAMAGGKPVLVAGNEGYQGLFGPEKLEEAQAGNFCCRGLPMSNCETLLADVVDVFQRSKEERTRLGAYGRSVILEHYSVRRMANDCLAMYHQVLHKKYRVLMSGYYGFSNAGDDAIMESIKQSVSRAGEDVELTVLSNNPELTQRQFGLKSVHRFRMNEVYSALRESDLLLFGGGSLLQDVTSTRSLVYYLSVIHAARKMGKPVMLYANGIGPVRKARNRRQVREAVEQATVVTLRDHDSATELRKMGVQRPDLTVTADPVFQLEPAEKKKGTRLLRQCGVPEGAKFVAVSLRSWPNAGRFPTQLAQLCDHLRQTYGLEIVFVLMQPKNDRTVTQVVRKIMKEPSYLLEGEQDPGELMSVLGQAELCLAMRLHTLIFAARMAVPTLGLVYDPKVESYLNELELPSAGHVERFELKTAMAQADKLIQNYESVRDNLKRKAADLAENAKENERLLMKLLRENQDQAQK